MKPLIAIVGPTGVGKSRLATYLAQKFNGKPLIAIVGPTGVGKSRLAIYLAQRFNGEIVNADSRQVYRHLDIGTAKPSPEEQSLVPHHLFDIVDPDEDFGLAQYQKLAYDSIYEITGRNRLPFLVGGSGQYVWAVLEGWEIPRIPPNPDFRKKLENIAADGGVDGLYQQLQDSDPVAAQKIDKRNVRRLIRALEVTGQSSIPFSQLQRKTPPHFNTLVIGLTANRDNLYQRVDSRVDQMVRQGLIAEIQQLLSKGYDFHLPAMNSIGYKQIGMMLRNDITREEAVKKIKVDSHRFVRHQYAWFRLKDRRIHWFDAESDIGLELMMLLADFLESD